jgi:hypothetical protein
VIPRGRKVIFSKEWKRQLKTRGVNAAGFILFNGKKHTGFYGSAAFNASVSYGAHLTVFYSAVNIADLAINSCAAWISPTISYYSA